MIHSVLHLMVTCYHFEWSFVPCQLLSIFSPMFILDLSVTNNGIISEILMLSILLSDSCYPSFELFFSVSCCLHLYPVCLPIHRFYHLFTVLSLPWPLSHMFPISFLTQLRFQGLHSNHSLINTLRCPPYSVAVFWNQLDQLFICSASAQEQLDMIGEKYSTMLLELILS